MQKVSAFSFGAVDVGGKLGGKGVEDGMQGDRVHVQKCREMVAWRATFSGRGSASRAGRKGRKLQGKRHQNLGWHCRGTKSQHQSRENLTMAETKGRGASKCENEQMQGQITTTIRAVRQKIVNGKIVC